MDEFFGSLQLHSIGAKSRLRAYIKCLQQEQHPQHQRKRAFSKMAMSPGSKPTESRVTPTIYDPELFYSPLETLLPESHEEITIEPFLAPERWLVETGAAVLEQANLVESDNPRVSPVALVRCSRGGKTRVSNWMVSHPLQHWNLLPTTVAVLHCWLPGPPCRPITRARLRRAM
jgi:hypothetical protein